MAAKNTRRRQQMPPRTARERQQTLRQDPPPRSPYQQHSGNMKGYNDEFMPPRPAQTDNTIEFPSGRTRPSNRSARTGAAAAGGARPRTQARPAQTARPAARQRTQQRPGQQPPPRTVPPAQSPVRREKRRRRKLTRKMLRRRRMLRRLTAAALVVCVAAVGIYLTVTMLFKINAIRVVGPDGAQLEQAGSYTSGEILDALGVQLEENIFSFDPAEKAAALEKAFPLLEDIEVRRSYPSTVLVQVTPATPAYAMETEAGWLSLSDGLKILSVSPSQPDLPVLYGGEPRSTAPGDELAYGAEAAAAGSAAESTADSAASTAAGEAEPDGRLSALHTLLDALEARGLLADVTRIEYADTEQIAFLYQNRISVLLGTLNELDYKLDYAEYMLLNKEGKGCAETDTGSLDCSHVQSDGSLRAIFAQGVPELPSGYVVAPAGDTADAAAAGEDAAAQMDGTDAAADAAAPADGTADTAAADGEAAAPAQEAAQ